MQSSVIKTMILVSTFFAITWAPSNIYYFLLNFYSHLNLLESTYYAFLLISFLYICVNPFIYAVKFEPVKRILLGLIPCKKTSVQPDDSIENTGTQSEGTAAVQ